MKTEKIYYKNPFQTSCETILIENTEKGLIFDKSVAYPEGGGQIGDVGVLIRYKDGRLDFSIDFKFTPEQIANIESRCKEYIDRNIPIEIFSHPEENEALYWKCNSYIVPCGGTHCGNTRDLSGIKIKRKNIGKLSERLIVELPFNEKFLSLYGD